MHGSEYANLKRPNSRRTGTPIEPSHKFEVNLEGDTFSAEKFDLFLRYQMKVHKEDESRWSHASFKRFLCSGISGKTVGVSGKTQKLGSYHQCYRLDGKLIAVGVLDLLPQAVSSVYLFYDPHFERHEFGKLSALREIALSMEGQYQHYYMGFYIHTCVKMRYKATFQPTFMLDPESLQWTLFDEGHRKQLDKTPYYSVSGRSSVGSDVQVSEPDSTAKEASLEMAKEFKSVNETVTRSTTKFADEISDMEVDPDGSSEEDTEIPDGSLFDHHMPGILTRDEVEKLDLDHWKLQVRDAFVDLEVNTSNKMIASRLTFHRTFETGRNGRLMTRIRSRALQENLQQL